MGLPGQSGIMGPVGTWAENRQTILESLTLSHQAQQLAAIYRRALA